MSINNDPALTHITDSFTGLVSVTIWGSQEARLEPSPVYQTKYKTAVSHARRHAEQDLHALGDGAVAIIRGPLGSAVALIQKDGQAVEIPAQLPVL